MQTEHLETSRELTEMKSKYSSLEQEFVIVKENADSGSEHSETEFEALKLQIESLNNDKEILTKELKNLTDKCHKFEFELSEERTKVNALQSDVQSASLKSEDFDIEVDTLVNRVAEITKEKRCFARQRGGF